MHTAIFAYFFVSLLTSGHVVSILQIDCVSQNLSRSDCIQYLGVYFQGFTGNSQVPIVPQEYSSSNFPQDMNIAIYDPIQNSVCNISSLSVSMAMQIKSVISVDALAGTITIDTWLNFIWNDDRLSWNETLTPIFSEEMTRIISISPLIGFGHQILNLLTQLISITCHPRQYTYLPTVKCRW